MQEGSANFEMQRKRQAGFRRRSPKPRQESTSSNPHFGIQSFQKCPLVIPGEWVGGGLQPALKEVCRKRTIGNYWNENK